MVLGDGEGGGGSDGGGKCGSGTIAGIDFRYCWDKGNIGSNSLEKCMIEVD